MTEVYKILTDKYDRRHANLHPELLSWYGNFASGWGIAGSP